MTGGARLRRIIVNVMPTEKRVAVIENGKVVEFYIDRPDRGYRVGNIYKGKVVDVLPGMDAAFVDIGYEKKAFLHVDDCLPTGEEGVAKGKKSISRYVQEGQEVLVQITKEAVGTKGARVTQQISLAGRYGVFLPLDAHLGISRRIQKESERERLQGMARGLLSPTEGMIIRTLAEGVEEQSFVLDLHILRTRWENALEEAKHLNPPALLYQDEDMLTRLARDLLREGVDEMIVDHTGIRQQLQALLSSYRPELSDKIHYYPGKKGIFDHFSLEAELDKALNKKVWLKNGGYLIIDRTEAMIVIDVNTGKFTGTDDLQRTVVKTNKEACQEIGRQLRLRDLAGIIIIDFIDMEKEEDRKEILSVMKNELLKDRTHTRIYGFTPLGLLELTRKRERRDLRELSNPGMYLLSWAWENPVP